MGGTSCLGSWQRLRVGGLWDPKAGEEEKIYAQREKQDIGGHMHKRCGIIAQWVLYQDTKGLGPTTWTHNVKWVKEGAVLDLCSFPSGSYWNERVVTDLGQRVLPALSVVGAGPAVILTFGPLFIPGKNCLWEKTMKNHWGRRWDPKGMDDRRIQSHKGILRFSE